MITHRARFPNLPILCWSIALALAVGQPARFDMIVRDDFFAGMGGDESRLNRAMEYCERVLASEPKHAEALVWHGSGLMTRASFLYAKGDSTGGDKAWEKGLQEINEAVALEPQRIDINIGRSAVLIGAAQSGWDASDPKGRELLLSAVKGYQLVLAAQAPQFAKVPVHGRGELLFGLATGWSILGDREKASHYLSEMVKECAGSQYAKEAQSWLRRTSTEPIVHECIGCHVGPSRISNEPVR